MKKAIFILAMISISAAVSGQADLTTGEQLQSQIRLGIYTHASSGSQDWAREFDGREFNSFGIELFNSYGFNGPTQYWLDARDVIIGDEDINFSLASANTLGISLGTSKLTHRLPRTPSINPFIAQMFANLSLPAPVPGDTGDAIIDLSPGVDFHLNRRVNSFDLGLTPRGNEGNRFVASWWQELESGTRQLLFRARAAAPGIIGNRQRGGAAVPIDRSTNEGALGADIRLGKSSVVNYRLTDTEFTNNGTRPGGALSTVFPLNALTQFNSKTTTNAFKARSKLSDQLYFTGTYSNKNRANLTSKIPANPGTTYQNAGMPLGAKIRVQNTNLGLTFLATSTLSLTGRWRRYDLDNEVPPVFSISGTPPVVAAQPDNTSLSREVTSTALDASYTGIRKAYLKLGFERRDTKRSVSPIHPPHPADEFEHPFTSDSTQADIVRLGARYYPTQGLSFSANFEDWNVDQPGYAGTPTDRQKINVNATYLIKDNLALYGDFIQTRDKNDQVRVASIPTLVTAPVPPLTPPQATAYAEDRENAAGQGYKNNVETTMLGAWYGLSPKLTLDTYFSKSSVDASATLIFGSDPGFLPNLAPDFTPFKADSDQWSFGSTYVLNPKWRLISRFSTSNSTGKTLVTVFPGGLGPTWTPVDVDSNRWTLGFTYDMSVRERLILDYSVLDWKDKIDSSQSGRFNLVRLAWSETF